MGTLRLGLSVSGTVMPREGGPPLFAVTSMVGDHLVQAAIIDPLESPDVYAEMMETSVHPPGGAVQSDEQPRP